MRLCATAKNKRFCLIGSVIMNVAPDLPVAPGVTERRNSALSVVRGVTGVADAEGLKFIA